MSLAHDIFDNFHPLIRERFETEFGGNECAGEGVT